jgi:hypothetical protein
MPLPANVTTVTVLGTFLTPEGDPSTGTISFTASSWLTNSGANVAIPNSTVTKTLGTAGNFSVSLPITDDPDISPSGFVYNVSEVVDGVSQNYNISIPGTIAGGGTLYLADLAPVAPAGPEYYSLASSLTIGTVTTVATGGSATASITGLAPSQVLNLGIPTGATGTITTAGSGSVGTATVAPPGDPDTGIYFPAANQVAVTTGGTQALLLASGAVSNPTFTGVASFPDGSAAAPSITNTGDLNTGLHFPDADTVAVSTGGTERLRVTSAGRVGIGTTAPNDVLDVREGNIIVQKTSGTPTLRALSTQASGYGPGSINLRRQGASGAATPDSSVIGEIRFDGTNTTPGYSVFAQIDSSIGANGTAGAPGNLIFSTNSGSALVQRLAIDSNGLITGTGTSLGAWTAYTPTLAGTGWAIGNGTASGYYCQIGKVMFIRVNIVFGNTSTFGAGGITCSLPANANGSFPAAASGVVRYVDSSASAIYAGHGGISSNTFAFQYFNTNGSGQLSAVTSTSAPFTWADTDIIRLTMAYEIA